MINKSLFFTSTWRRHLIYYYCFCFRSSGFVPNTTLPTPVITVRVTRRARSVDCMGVAKRYHECNTAVRPIFLMCFMCSLKLRKDSKTKKKLRPPCTLNVHTRNIRWRAFNKICQRREILTECHNKTQIDATMMQLRE